MRGPTSSYADTSIGIGMKHCRVVLDSWWSMLSETDGLTRFVSPIRRDSAPRALHGIGVGGTLEKE